MINRLQNCSYTFDAYKLRHRFDRQFSEQIRLKAPLQRDIVSFTSRNFHYKPSVPDSKQLDIPGCKEYYCAPTSTANGIKWLSQNGFPNLYQENNLALIRELARYFRTDKKGTTSNNLCIGLETFINLKGYRHKKIEYQGFRPTYIQYATGKMHPDLEWIKNGIEKSGMVLLNLGIYKKSVQDGKTVYRRQYGHWVTAVGHGLNGKTLDPDYLTIHDPYSKEVEDKFIRLNKITDGQLVHNSDDNESVLTDNARDFYEVTGKFNYFNSDEVGIINGAIVLEMNHG